MDDLRPGAGWEVLPQEAPLAMRVQDLAHAPPRRSVPDSPAGTTLRRLAVIGGAMAMTAVATAQMSQVLGLARFTVTGLAMTALFALLFVWLALSFTSALAGLPALLSRRTQDRRGLPRSRTALLMPVYNEDMGRIAPGLAAMRADIAAAGATAWFDVFVLSDSTDPARRDAEGAAVRLLGGVAGAALYYRHRPQNIDRKAGNIAEWVGRFGAAYEQFLILDADSLMDARSLLALVAEMERQPDTGLLQTLPVLIGAQTLLARLQQFASHAYGPLIAAGIAAWHGAEGNYWGHNALIRTRAFAACCGLPHLPGRKPFGGTILSHDFVEAALLRRGGWAVRMLPRLPGSYEAGPPTLPDMAARDRRWCQGNLQHAAVLPARGLHWVSRLHMLTGIVAYASAPLWLGFLLLGIVVALQARFLRPEYFPQTHTLFPQWPVVDPERAITVFVATVLVLLAPKLLALAALLREAGGFAGAWRLVASVAIEIVLSALLSPVTMVTQARQFFQVLRGADGGWQPQRRDGGGMGLGESWRYGAPHVMLGIVLLAIAIAVAPLLAAWMAPVLIGLVAAPAILAISSSTAAGEWFRRHRLLATPAELVPSPLLRAAAAAPPFCLRERAPPSDQAARKLPDARYPDHPWHPLPLSRPGPADRAPADDPPAGQPRPAAARGHAHRRSSAGDDEVGA